jgi:DNA-binding SARP family transcriptional activator
MRVSWPTLLTEPAATGRYPYRIRLVGEPAVVRSLSGRSVGNLGSRKARQLLTLLAVEFGHVVPTDRIVAALWHDAPPRDPAANIATLVSRLRSRLGPDVVLGGRYGYRLGDHITVDLYEAAVLVRHAESLLADALPSAALDALPSAALDAAKRALAILETGTAIASESDAMWAEPARQLQATLLRRARHAVAEAAVRVGDPVTAQAAAHAAIAADGLDEAAYRALMRACDANDEPARALTTYMQLRDVLAAELGVDPAPATRALHVAILRGTATALGPRGR